MKTMKMILGVDLGAGRLSEPAGYVEDGKRVASENVDRKLSFFGNRFWGEGDV